MINFLLQKKYYVVAFLKITITELPEIPNSLQMRRISLAVTSGMKPNDSKLSLGLILSPNRWGPQVLKVVSMPQLYHAGKM